MIKKLSAALAAFFVGLAHAAAPIPTVFATLPGGNVAASTLDTNFALIANYNTFSNYLVDSGVANVYVVTFAASTTGSLIAGLSVNFKAGADNTGASTLAVNGMAAKAITNWDASALTAGQIKAGAIVSVIYDGTQFKLTGQFTGGTVPGTLSLTSPAITTSITTPSTTFSLLNTTATTLNIGGAATTVAIGAGAASTLNANFTTAINLNTAAIVSNQTTVALLNTTATTLNFAGAATTLNIGNAGGTNTILGASNFSQLLTANAGLTVPTGQAVALNGTTTLTLGSGTLSGTGAISGFASVSSGAVTATGGDLKSIGSNPIITVGDTTNGAASLRIVGRTVASGFRNWQISSGVITGADVLDFTPSTAAGGTSFSTSVMKLGYDGSLTAGAISGTTGAFSGGQLNTGTVSTRIESTHGAAPSGSAGVGFEAGVNGGVALLQSYNRTSAVYSPFEIAASTITLTGNTTVTGTLTTSNTTYLHITSAALANGAAAQVATMTNGPTAGNPTKWIAINDNGTPRYIPAW